MQQNAFSMPPARSRFQVASRLGAHRLPDPFREQVRQRLALDPRQDQAEQLGIDAAVAALAAGLERQMGVVAHEGGDVPGQVHPGGAGERMLGVVILRHGDPARHVEQVAHGDLAEHTAPWRSSGSRAETRSVSASLPLATAAPTRSDTIDFATDQDGNRVAGPVPGRCHSWIRTRPAPPGRRWYASPPASWRAGRSFPSRGRAPGSGPAGTAGRGPVRAPAPPGWGTRGRSRKAR